MIRIGVIGTGVMGADHARLLQHAVSGATVTAVADLDVTRAGAVAKALGARVATCPQELIAAGDVDAVVVASHDSAHAEQVLACLEHRKPVLCEKPLAPTVAECESIVAHQSALEMNTELISVGYMRRFHSGFIDLKAQVATGRLGEPLLVRSSQRTVRSYPDGGSEGTIMNTAVHDIDLVAWLLESPVVEVSWHAPRSTSEDTGRHDPQLIHLRTAEGVLVVVDIFLNARYGFDTRYEILCERGAVRLAPFKTIDIDADFRSFYSYPEDWRAFYAQAYRDELQAWVTSVANRCTSALATARDGLQATKVAAALVTSMHERGRTVTIGEIGRHLVPPQL